MAVLTSRIDRANQEAQESHQIVKKDTREDVLKKKTYIIRLMR